MKLTAEPLESVRLAGVTLGCDVEQTERREEPTPLRERVGVRGPQAGAMPNADAGASVRATRVHARLHRMNVPLRKPMTLPQFLAWEERQELRYEFDGFHPVAMTGGTLAHELIGGALRALLQERLRGKSCTAVGPTLKIEVMGRIRYPDAFVYCAPVPPSATVIPAPVVVFEVLSPGTSRTDRIEKLLEYQATTSIQRYVILEQDSIAATVFARHGNDWVVHALTAGDVLRMPEIEVELPLADIYVDVPLPTQPDDDTVNAASGNA
jgi:Uma2 family endonuclease